MIRTLGAWLAAACLLLASGAIAATTSTPAHIHVGLLSYGTASETQALGVALQQALQSRQERPPVSYRVTALNVAYTDVAAAEGAECLRRLHVDIVFLTSPVLIDKVLDKLDRVPVVVTGQALLSELTGYFATLARPGGRVTGFIREPTGLAKRVELLQSFCPQVRRVGVVLGTDSSADQVFLTFLANENEQLRSRGAVIVPVYLTRDALVSSLPEVIRTRHLDALNISVSTDVRDRFDELRSALQALGIPHVYSQTSVVERGGALGAQPASFDVARTGADYISRIIHGEPPGEIPIQISRAYDIAVNVDRIKDFKGCDPRRIAKIATRFIP